MRTETIEGYLTGAAAHAPVPGTGPGAALHAAQGAALVAAVARSAVSPDAAARTRDRCDELRELALDLADEDARIAVAVAAAPRPGEGHDGADAGDDGAEVRRAAALLAAGRLAVRVIGVTDRVLALAEALRPVGGRAAAPGIAAAAETLRAAAGTARVNVEVTLVGITDPVVREELLDAVEHVDDLVLRAAKVTAAVREQIVR